MSLRSSPQSLESDLTSRFGLGLRLSERNVQRPLALPDLQKLAAVGIKLGYGIKKSNILKRHLQMAIDDLEIIAKDAHDKLMQANADTTRSSGPRRSRQLPIPEKLHCDKIKAKITLYFQDNVSFPDAIEKIEETYSDDMSLGWYIYCTSEFYAHNFKKDITVEEFRQIEDHIAQKLLNEMDNITDVFKTPADPGVLSYADAAEEYVNKLEELKRNMAGGRRQTAIHNYIVARTNVMKYVNNCRNAMCKNDSFLFVAYDAQYRKLTKRLQMIATEVSQDGYNPELYDVKNMPWENDSFKSLPLFQAVKIILDNTDRNKPVLDFTHSLYTQLLPHLVSINGKMPLVNWYLRLPEMFEGIQSDVKQILTRVTN